MTRQTPEPLKDWRLTGASDREAIGIVRSMLDQMDMNPPYQRGSVWTKDQRVALIKSLLMGVPVPALILNDRSNPEWLGLDAYLPGESVWAVVDGKQRIETMAAWYGNEFAVPASWFEREYVDTRIYNDDGPHVCFRNLTVVGQRRIMRQFRLPVIEAKLPSLAAEAELYLLVNGGGTMQTDADMANAARVARGGAS